MDGLQSGPTVMMTLGAFQFGISTAAYQELKRVTEWRWPVQERFQQGQALQYVGPGGDTITLPGVIYPEYRGGFGQVKAMRELGDQGEPLTIIDGLGNVMGQWVMVRLEEGQTVFAASGLPRKQEFTLELRKYATSNAASAATTGASSAVAAVTQAVTAPSGMAAFVASATSTVTSVTGTISSALSQVSGFASDLGDAANSVLTPLRSSLGTANTLLNSLNDAQRLLGMKPTQISALSSATKMMNAATSASLNASQAGRTLANAASQVQALGTLPQNAMNAVQAAVTGANKLTVTATAIQQKASAAVKNLTT